MFEIDSALRTLVEREGSDLHVKVAAQPTARLRGELTPLEGYEPLTEKDTEKAFHDIAEVRSLTEFEEAGEADFSYAISGPASPASASTPSSSAARSRLSAARSPSESARSRSSGCRRSLTSLDATETINRIIDFFPPTSSQARVMLAATLKAAIVSRSGSPK